MRTKTKPEILKTILSPEAIQAGESMEQQHAQGIQELKDEITKREQFVAPDNGADVASPQNQLGRAMTRADVVRKLQKLNSNLIYEQSKNWPEFGGLYIQDYGFDELTMKPIGKRHLCGFPHDVVAEFDVRIVVKDRVPDPTIPLHWIEVPKLEGHVPGWRSTILKLVKGGYINLTAAEHEFSIYEGRSSERWSQAIH